MCIGVFRARAGASAGRAWLADHRVFGRLLLPGAAILEMLAAIVSKVMHWKRPQLTDFAVQRPLLLPEPDEGHARWQVIVKPLSADRVELALYAAMPAGDGAGTDQEGAEVEASTFLCKVEEVRS